jgi:rRNA maturation protein Rpf1
MFAEFFEEQKHQMRAAADWQLEQVEKSVERKIKVLRQSGYVFAADAIEDFFQGIMQNMRPQEDDNK